MSRLQRLSVSSIGTLLVAIGLIAGCSAPQKETPLTTLKVGYVPIADCLQLYVGVDEGIFRKHGLDIQMTSLQSGQRIIEALIAGDLQLGIANVVSTATAHAKGVPLVSITGGAMEVPDHVTRALLVSSDSEIKSAADLIGKKVAVNGLKNIEHLKLLQYLQLHSVPAARVSVVEAPFPQMEGVLMNKSVDAAMAIEPFLSVALKHGTVRVLGRPYIEVSQKTNVSSYVTLASWLDKQQGTAAAFAAAIADATDFIEEQPQKAREIVIKYTKLPADVANDVTLPKFEARFDAADLQPMIDELVRQGIIPATVPANEIFKRF